MLVKTDKIRPTRWPAATPRRKGDTRLRGFLGRRKLFNKSKSVSGSKTIRPRRKFSALNGEIPAFAGIWPAATHCRKEDTRLRGLVSKIIRIRRRCNTLNVEIPAFAGIGAVEGCLDYNKSFLVSKIIKIRRRCNALNGEIPAFAGI